MREVWSVEGEEEGPLRCRQPCWTHSCESLVKCSMNSGVRRWSTPVHPRPSGACAVWFEGAGEVKKTCQCSQPSPGDKGSYAGGGGIVMNVLFQECYMARLPLTLSSQFIIFPVVNSICLKEASFLGS